MFEKPDKKKKWRQWLSRCYFLVFPVVFSPHSNAKKNGGDFLIEKTMIRDYVRKKIPFTQKSWRRHNIRFFAHELLTFVVDKIRGRPTDLPIKSRKVCYRCCNCDWEKRKRKKYDLKKRRTQQASHHKIEHGPWRHSLFTLFRPFVIASLEPFA